MGQAQIETTPRDNLNNANTPVTKDGRVFRDNTSATVFQNLDPRTKAIIDELFDPQGNPIDPGKSIEPDPLEVPVG